MSVHLQQFTPVGASANKARRVSGVCMLLIRAVTLNVLPSLKAFLSIVTFDDKFDSSIRKLCHLARVDAALCLANAKQMIMSEPFGSEYKCVKSLRELASKMITLKHSVVYTDFFKLVIYLLTLPVTSATCERAHSKVDLIKSAVRACMLSDRLEDLVIISTEKSVVDSLDLSSVVNRFAMIERGLPL